MGIGEEGWGEKERERVEEEGEGEKWAEFSRYN